MPLYKNASPLKLRSVPFNYRRERQNSIVEKAREDVDVNFILEYREKYGKKISRIDSSPTFAKREWRDERYEKVLPA